MTTFDTLGLSQDLLYALETMHFKQCTPVQEQAIPIILNGNDLLAVAQTGTGKTAAYLLPIIDEILSSGCPQDTVNCLIIVPTRELAMQVDQQLQGFGYYVPISSIAVYGGTDGKIYTQQHRSLTEGVDIVIATPGRLIAHMAMGDVDISNVKFLVLDEADRMLDMGFCDDIMKIISKMSRERQTLLISATMPREIEKLAQAILNRPQKVKLAIARPPEKINQQACKCAENEKLPILKALLKTPDIGKCIVFVSSKLKVKEISKELRQFRLKVAEMHSDLDQTVREQTMRDFKAGKIHVLVATDLVARGIDIDDIEIVVNYDVPRDCDDYVHRVGRTARAERDGQSLTLVNGKDLRAFNHIQEFLQDNPCKIIDAKERFGIETTEIRDESPRRRKRNFRPSRKPRNNSKAKPRKEK